MRSTELFAHRRADGTFEDFFGNTSALGLCGHKKDIFRVRVTEDPEGPMWGWWCSRTSRHTMIFAHKDKFEICFPYGSKASEQAGQGEVVRLRVEPLKEF